ncbi:MAG: hypothetical protein GEV08_07320 [Acidimicrobiia bacterium]|nr:hypothetical protein [Acidimicrobiia bacterium]
MPVPATRNATPARRLAAALEPVVGQVYFSPECHAGYQALGFARSPARAGRTALPDGPAYFTSRGSVMGQVAGHVVAAAFSVFDPAAVVPAVTYGWALTDAPTIGAARDRGAIAQLRRVLGDDLPDLGRVADLLERAAEPLRVEGRPLYAGLRSLDVPEDPMGRMWRLGDLLREYRGDSHTIAWASAGLDPVEIGLLTELFIGLPLRSYIRTRAWPGEAVDAGLERLRSRALVEDDQFTEAGFELREAIEAATDTQLDAAVAALGEDLEELVGALGPWGAKLRQAGAYLGGGAADLARQR